MMRGASADAYAAAAEVLPSSGDLGRVGQDLFGTADLFRSEPGLRRVATDVSLRGEAKADLLRGVLADKVSAEALDVVAAAVSSEPGDLATLLRNVQAWIREESLYAIRFMLDNEIYVLAAGATERKSPSFLIPVEEIEAVDEVEESPRAA